MSTQAPSAATGNAPSVGTGEGEGGEGSLHLPSPKQVREGKAALPRQIKPIPPKAKSKVQLPGVDTGFDSTSAFDAKIAKAIGRGAEPSGGVDMGDGAEFGSQTGAEAKARAETGAESGETAARERGADGKFLKAAGAEQEQEGAEGESEDQEPAEVPEPPAEEAEIETVESLSAKYKEVEQRYKSLQGMFKPIQLKAQDAIREQHGAAKSATAWKAKADALEAELSQLRSGNGNGAAPLAASGREAVDPGRTPSSRVEAIVKAIDWKMYGSVKEQGDDAVAVWLTDQILTMADADRKKDIETLRSEFNEFAQPIRDTGKMKEIANHATEVFTRVAEIKDESGEPAFPELYDATEAEAVGKAWVESGKPPEEMLSPRGVIDAILFYRFITGKNRTAPPPAAATETQGEGEEEVDENEDVNASGGNARPSRALLGSRAFPSLRPPPSSPGDTRDLAASIKNAMRSSAETDNLFGFPTRKRR